MKSRFGGVVGAAGLLVVAACTPTTEEAIAKNRGNAESFRQVLGAVAGAIEAMPLPAENARCKPPVPLGFSPNGDGHDTEVYVFADLRRGGAPTKPEERPKIDLSQATPMHTLLADTHPSRALAPAEAKEKKPEKVKAYERAARTKNVVVLRERGHDRERGVLFLDYFVVTLDGVKIGCAGSVTARADPNLGARAYDVTGTDDAGVRRVVASGQVDLYTERLQLDAYKKLEERFRDDLAIDLPKP